MLTISAAVFISAVATFTRQNNRTQFTESVNNFAQDIQDVLNDVETGYYPVAGNFGCRVSGANPPSVPPIGSTEQGKNDQCIFIGRAVQFAASGNLGQADIYTIVGRRTTASTPPKPTANIDEARPTTLSNLVVDNKFLSASVEVYDVQNATVPANKYAGIAVVSTSTGTSSSISSGVNARASLASVGSAFGGNFLTGINDIGSDDINRARQGINICLRESGGNGRFAILNLGADSNRNQIVIDVRIDQQCPTA